MGFGTDFPVNDNNNEPDWNSYRFSLSHMQSLSNHFTHLRNCEDIADNGASQSGKYDIFDSANKPFSVYCDLQSEPGFVWALIQSLSFANEATYKDKGFGNFFFWE